MSLRDYEAVKYALADMLRAAIAAAGPQQSIVREQAGELFARMAEDRFNLLVVGRFSRGKSSLMNAVLGTERLPTGVLPLTSVITSVGYGNPEALSIEYRDNRFGFEAPIEDLAEYTSERGNPGNQRGVHIAHVALPSELLRRGFFFVDSPGLGSVIAQNTRTTEAFLPQADALVMVSGFDGPLSEDEVRILRLLKGSGIELFLILNKQDTVTDDERQAVCEFVRTRLRELWEGSSPRLFSLSALQALAANRVGDQTALEASGVVSFERELTRFLLEERGGAFLRGMCDRVQRVFAQIQESPELVSLRERLNVFRSTLAAGRIHRPTAGEVSALGQVSSPGWQTCALCTAVHGQLFDYLARYQHQLATAPTEAQRLAHEWGLCAPHLRLYASLAVGRDLCVALTPLLQQWVDALGTLPTGELLAVKASCRLCELQTRVETQIVAGWQRLEGGSPGFESPMLCLPHLQGVIASLGKPMAASLMTNHGRAIERLTEEMQRYVIKRDGTRAGLTTQDETQAAERALAVLAGARTLAA